MPLLISLRNTSILNLLNPKAEQRCLQSFEICSEITPLSKDFGVSDWIIMNLPVILFGLTAAFLLGVLYHAVRGGNGLRFLLNLLLSAVGFAFGQLVGWWFGFVLYAVGDLDVALGAIGGVLILILGDWLSHIKPREESGV